MRDERGRPLFDYDDLILYCDDATFASWAIMGAVFVIIISVWVFT